MTEIPRVDDSAVASAARELGSLQEQVKTARAVLVRLLQEAMEVEGPLGNAQAPKLVEANEQLVIAALRAQTDAEAASRKLDEVSRSAELDALTQLPNRVLFCDRVAQAIARAKRRGSQQARLTHHELTDLACRRGVIGLFSIGHFGLR